MISVTTADLDHFEKLNDTFGHDAGDRALRKVRGLLEHAPRLEFLPLRLARDSSHAQERLRAIAAERDASPSGKNPVDEALVLQKHQPGPDQRHRARSQLTDDAQLMRATSALFTVMQLK